MQQVRDRPPEVMAKIVKFYPMGRVGRPDDIAAAVGFLSSEAAGFITGQTLPVNGGFVTT
jgi:NAD(P)-dependent dehydrogenase (short-subunit alcohol dehydrogenase family)